MSPGAPRLAVAALFAGIVLLSWTAAWLLSGGPSERIEDPSSYLPDEGLLASVSARDLAGAVASLRELPVYRGLAARLAPGTAAIPRGTPGAVGLYRRGWARVAATPSRTSPWRLTHVGGAVEERPPRPAVDLPGLPATGLALRVEPGSFLEERGRSHPVLALAARGLPGSLRGNVVPGAAGEISERWEIVCPPGSGLDILSRLSIDGAEARGWTVVPSDPDAVVWLRVDPGRLAPGHDGGERPLRSLEPLERFLDLPLREALARSLAGPAVLAFEDPGTDGSPKALASFDLVGPDAARATLDRVFALGMIAEALEVRLYRGARIAAWRSRAGGPEGPAIALDGDLLLLAPTAREIREAVDRRRDGSAGGRALRQRLEALPRGAWKAWSRSPYLASAWEEILGGWAAKEEVDRFEVTAYGAYDGDRFVLESRGTASALACEPVVPTARSVWRSARGLVAGR